MNEFIFSSWGFVTVFGIIFGALFTLVFAVLRMEDADEPAIAGHKKRKKKKKR